MRRRAFGGNGSSCSEIQSLMLNGSLTALSEPLKELPFQSMNECAVIMEEDGPDLDMKAPVPVTRSTSFKPVGRAACLSPIEYTNKAGAG